MGKSILGGFAEKSKEQLVENGIQNIHFTNIVPAKENRDIGDVSNLTEDILEDGLETNLLVRVLDNNIYEIVAGHRRYHALTTLIADGHDQFEYVPCKVVELSDMDAKKRLIMNNIQIKNLTAIEMLSAIEDLKEIYKQKKATGEKIPGRVRDLIAEDVGLKKSQIGNYEKILNNAIPEVRELINEGELSVGVATELSTLDDEEQLMFVEQGDEISLQTIKEYKDSLNEETDNEEIDIDVEDYEEEDSFVFEQNETDEVFEEVEELETYKEEIEPFNEDVMEAMNQTSRSARNIELMELVMNDWQEYLKGVEWHDEREMMEEVLMKYNKFKKMMTID